jgi:hypothetical protein
MIMGIFDFIAEQRIKEAIAKGEFDNLEGFGKPIDNTEYFSAPEEDRIAFHILKNAGVVPEEVELRKSIYEISKEILATEDINTRSLLENKKIWLEDRLFVLIDNRKFR